MARNSALISTLPAATADSVVHHTAAHRHAEHSSYFPSRRQIFFRYIFKYFLKRLQIFFVPSSAIFPPPRPGAPRIYGRDYGARTTD